MPFLYRSNFLKYRLLVDKALTVVRGHLLSKFCQDSVASLFRMWGALLLIIRLGTLVEVGTQAKQPHIFDVLDIRGCIFFNVLI